jgi:maltooligosyltrehalose synthase
VTTERRATYRLQLHEKFTIADSVPYFADLGLSDL